MESSEIDSLYEQYGKPLEEEHWDEYLAVHPDGRTLVGKDRHELRKQANSRIGEGSVIIKIGKRVSRGFRWLRPVPDPPGIPVHPEEDSTCTLSLKETAERRAKLYAQHGKPLEKKHRWQFVAIQPDGKTIVDGDCDVLMERARIELGKGSYVFRIGGSNSGTTVKPLEMILYYHD